MSVYSVWTSSATGAATTARCVLNFSASSLRSFHMHLASLTTESQADRQTNRRTDGQRRRSVVLFAKFSPCFVNRVIIYSLVSYTRLPSIANFVGQSRIWRLHGVPMVTDHHLANSLTGQAGNELLPNCVYHSHYLWRYCCSLLEQFTKRLIVIV